MTIPLRLLLAGFLAVTGLLPAPLGGAEAHIVTIRRVVDGDTLLLSDGRRVRLIGVDTPEHHPSPKLQRDARETGLPPEEIQAAGRQATAFVRELIGEGSVRLEFDDANERIGHKDHYGRLLAYVYVEGLSQKKRPPGISPEDAASAEYQAGFLNAVLVQAGFAEALTRYPFQFRDRFSEWERRARETSRGLWKKTEDRTASPLQN